MKQVCYHLVRPSIQRSPLPTLDSSYQASEVLHLRAVSLLTVRCVDKEATLVRLELVAHHQAAFRNNCLMPA